MSSHMADSQYCWIEEWNVAWRPEKAGDRKTFYFWLIYSFTYLFEEHVLFIEFCVCVCVCVLVYMSTHVYAYRERGWHQVYFSFIFHHCFREQVSHGTWHSRQLKRPARSKRFCLSTESCDKQSSSPTSVWVLETQARLYTTT